MDHRGWYEEVYPRLTGGGLWLRGGELNTLPVEEHGRRSLRVLFARLSTYFDTAASFTHQLLYQLAATSPDVFTTRRRPSRSRCRCTGWSARFSRTVTS